MKLRTLAIAVAMASVPFAAQAEFKVGGDVGVGYFKHGDGETFFGGHGSEVTFDASEKVGGLTFFGHFEVNVAGATVSSRADVEDGGTDGGGTDAGDNLIDETDSDDLLMENITSWVTSGFTIRDSFGNHLQTVNGVS